MYIKLIDKYNNKWIALNRSRTKVLAFAETAEDLSKKTKNLKEELIFSFIMDKKRTYAPVCRKA